MSISISTGQDPELKAGINSIYPFPSLTNLFHSQSFLEIRTAIEHFNIKRFFPKSDTRFRAPIKLYFVFQQSLLRLLDEIS